MTGGLQGEKVRLRALASKDLEILRGFINDPEVLAQSNAYRPISDAQQEAWWRAVMSDSYTYWFGIEELAASTLVGTCCLVDVDWIVRQAELRVRLGDKAAWGRGLGADACDQLVRYGFEHLNLSRIWLRVFASNERAQRLYSRLGFQVEGRLRRAWHVGGVTDDVIVMGLLRDEWSR